MLASESSSSDFFRHKLNPGTIDHDFLDGAVGDAVEDGGFLFGGEAFREADFGFEACQGQRAAGAGEGLAVDFDAFCRHAQGLAGFLGVNGGAGGEGGVEGFQRVHQRTVQRVFGAVLAASDGDFRGVVDDGGVHAVLPWLVFYGDPLRGQKNR